MRFVRGIGALAALLVGLVGIPLALAMLGGNPLPSTLTLDALADALLRPDDGSVLIGLVTIVGWLAWLVFAFSVITELISILSGYRIRIRLPGLAMPQALAAALIVMVLGLLATPQVVQAEPAQPTQPTPTLSSTERPAQRVRALPGIEVASKDALRAPGPEESLVHTVERGDDLWSLAERYYGQGREWRKIAIANPEVLTGGPDRLEPGWRLSIPVATNSEAASTGDKQVVVGSGDTLSSIAQVEYGDAARWPLIFEANSAQLTDPDQIDVGMRLRILASAEHESDQKRDRAAQPDEDRTERPTETEANKKADREGDEGKKADGTSGRAAPRHPPPPETTPRQPADRPPPQQRTDNQQPTRAAGAPQASTGSEVADGVDHLLPGIGGLLAAGLLGGLAVRRRMQLQARPLGRRILQPPPAAQAVESALGRRQRPVTLRTLDLAVRSIAAHCHQTQTTLPVLTSALVSEDEIVLTMTQTANNAPVGFSVSGRIWTLNAADADYLKKAPGLSDAARPYPALVSVGCDEQGAQLLVDLESISMLSILSDDESLRAAALAAIALELSFSLWADEMFLTLVGTCAALPDALGKHNVTHTTDIEALLDRLEKRAEVQREHLQGSTIGHYRIDPDLADPWAPEVLLINTELHQAQQQRLETLLLEQPRITLAAVTTDDRNASPWKLKLTRQDPVADGGTDVVGLLAPLGLTIRPQLVDEGVGDNMIKLISATGSEQTTPAPWWSRDEEESTDLPPNNLTFINARTGGWANKEAAMVEDPAVIESGPVHHPTLRMLGPVTLVGALGPVPSRASKQCLEYCGWLLEHPGTTSHAMAAALAVAETTRRSNMSRLRAWLGGTSNGGPYLPDAYSGRIALHHAVSSDWQRLQILTAGGVDKATTDGLRAALRLVRGAPLADAAPGQWHWAEELRTDMSSAVRDIGVELSARALTSGDIDLARWAAARSLTAAPEDELLMCARIRTESLAGNAAEIERLSLQVAGHARTLGVDLDSETVALLQQVMEGRVRARLA